MFMGVVDQKQCINPPALVLCRAFFCWSRKLGCCVGVNVAVTITSHAIWWPSMIVTKSTVWVRFRGNKHKCTATYVCDADVARASGLVFTAKREWSREFNFHPRTRKKKTTINLWTRIGMESETRNCNKTREPTKLNNTNIFQTKSCDRIADKYIETHEICHDLEIPKKQHIKIVPKQHQMPKKKKPKLLRTARRDRKNGIIMIHVVKHAFQINSRALQQSPESPFLEQ